MEPSTDFLNILTLGFDSARPVEYMKYLPDGAQFRQNTLSDGPYQITSYSPGKGYTLDRNQAWKQSTDTLRHAYIDKVVITEGLTAENVQEQLQAGTGDLEWDVTPPTQDLPALEGSSNLVIGPPGNYYVSLNLYLALNQYAGPFTNKLVREAAAYAVDKNAIIQIAGGPKIAAVANQPILPGNTGYIPGYNPYPDNNGNGNAAKAKALLKQAGYPHGVKIKLLAARRPRSMADRSATAAALVFYSMPPFLLGLVLVFFLFFQLHLAGVDLFPGSGYVGILANPASWAQHLVLPWVTLALVTATTYERLTRGALLDVLGEDYIRTARAKGLSERRVVYRHGLRSALTPVVTQFGIDLGTLLGGAIVVENVFGLPGLGVPGRHFSEQPGPAGDHRPGDGGFGLYCCGQHRGRPGLRLPGPAGPGAMSRSKEGGTCPCNGAALAP